MLLVLCCLLCVLSAMCVVRCVLYLTFLFTVELSHGEGNWHFFSEQDSQAIDQGTDTQNNCRITHTTHTASTATHHMLISTLFSVSFPLTSSLVEYHNGKARAPLHNGSFVDFSTRRWHGSNKKDI